MGSSESLARDGGREGEGVGAGRAGGEGERERVEGMAGEMQGCETEGGREGGREGEGRICMKCNIVVILHTVSGGVKER